MSDCARCGGSAVIECPHCKGSGYEPASDDMSLSGWVEAAVDAVGSVVTGPEECHVCGGDGYVPCPDCG